MSGPLRIASRMKVDVEALADRDPKSDFGKVVREMIGSLDKYQVLGSNVLVATYVRPRKTAGGILLTDNSIHEDRWQGILGLVLKMGDAAFTFDGAYEYKGPKAKVGDYVMFHTSDARELSIKGISIKLVDSSLIRMIVPDPMDLY